MMMEGNKKKMTPLRKEAWNNAPQTSAALAATVSEQKPIVSNSIKSTRNSHGHIASQMHGPSTANQGPFWALRSTNSNRKEENVSFWKE